MSIREKGEGTFYQEKSSGLWVHQITYRDEFGKLKRKKFRGKTRAIAKENSNRFLHPDADNPIIKTLGTWADYWLENIVKSNIEPKTFSKYESNLKQYIIPFFGDKPVESLTFDELQKHFAWLQEYGGKKKTGISSSTVASARRTLIQAIDAGIKLGFFHKNPVKLTKAPKISKKEISVLSPEEEKRLITSSRVLDDEYYQHMMPELLQLALRTGMRRGELLGLFWEDIDEDGCSITVNRQLSEVKGKGKVLKPPKTKNSRRRISIARADVESLLKYKEWQEEFFAGIPMVEDNRHLVFRSIMGNPIDGSNLLERHFRPLLKYCGIQSDFRFHDLRHTHATRLLQNKVNPKVVQERLGHSSIKVTMDTYSHVLPDIQQSAVEALGERL